MPLTGIRIVSAIVGAFSSKGGLAEPVIFGTLPEFLVMINYISVRIGLAMWRVIALTRVLSRVLTLFIRLYKGLFLDFEIGSVVTAMNLDTARNQLTLVPCYHPSGSS